ncbi:hypothetical protein ACSUZJ_14155 [Telluria sp. B2]
MRTPLSFLAALLAAALLSACQASTPSASINQLPHEDPTETSTSLADSPQVGGTGSAGASSSGEQACLRGKHECSTDKQCCSGRCMQAGSASGICGK